MPNQAALRKLPLSGSMSSNKPPRNTSYSRSRYQNRPKLTSPEPRTRASSRLTPSLSSNDDPIASPAIEIELKESAEGTRIHNGMDPYPKQVQTHDNKQRQQNTSPFRSFDVEPASIKAYGPTLRPRVDVGVLANHLQGGPARPRQSWKNLSLIPREKDLSHIVTEEPVPLFSAYDIHVNPRRSKVESFNISPFREVDQPPQPSLFVSGTSAPNNDVTQQERLARLNAIWPALKTLRESDFPPPEPYNAAYPHPISAYASPGVNPAALASSNYEETLQHLLRYNRDKLKGTILAGAEGSDILPPALTMVIVPGEGNGIPERLWTRFESLGAARLQVGAATATPHARVDPTSGSFVRALSGNMDRGSDLPPRFMVANAELWDTRSTIQSRRGSEQGPLEGRYEESEDFKLYLKMFVDRNRSFEASPWFKTEICPVWEDTGLCKYGKACQYAHGLQELRMPSKIAPLPTPPLENKPLDDYYFPEGSFPYPSPMTPVSQPNSLASRRASAPPPDLRSVFEQDEDVTPYWTREDVPPIGAERESPKQEKRHHSLVPLQATKQWQHFDYDEYADPTPRPGKIMSDRSPPRHNLSSSVSSLESQLTASSSDIGQRTQWSPLDGVSDLVSSYGTATSHQVESSKHWLGRQSETSIDFSAGRSIWR